MSEIKKYSPDEKDVNLKREDKKKSHGSSGLGSSHTVELFGGKRIADKSLGSNVKVKKKLPLVVDIIAGILMLAIVCGVVVGSYMLFRRYANDYETKSINYTIVFSVDKDINKYASMTNGELYMDVNGNTEYFGKILSVRLENGAETSGNVIATINASVQYRGGDGYSIGETKIAVGSTHSLRWGERDLNNVTVVEISEAGGK